MKEKGFCCVFGQPNLVIPHHHCKCQIVYFYRHIYSCKPDTEPTCHQPLFWPGLRCPIIGVKLSPLHMGVLEEAWGTQLHESKVERRADCSIFHTHTHTYGVIADRSPRRRKQIALRPLWNGHLSRWQKVPCLDKPLISRGYCKTRMTFLQRIFCLHICLWKSSACAGKGLQL